jgi:hypothetical protein
MSEIDGSMLPMPCDGRPWYGRDNQAMTLILTLMRPGEGVWQTVDARVTVGSKPVDNFASKQLSVHRGDGTLLIAYTGLAEVPPSGESMFDWLRGTLRGQNRSPRVICSTYRNG